MSLGGNIEEVGAFLKVEIAQRRGEPIGKGWAADQGGKETLHPDEVSRWFISFARENRSIFQVLDKESGALKGGLLPLGGAEASGGYKGSGIATMVGRHIYSAAV